MKKVYLLVAAVVSLYASKPAAAANTDPDDTAAIARRAVVLTRALATKVHLDEGQYLKLKQLNTRLLTEMQVNQQEEYKVMSALDKHAAATQAQYRSEMLALLYPAQQQLYRQF